MLRGGWRGQSAARTELSEHPHAALPAPGPAGRGLGMRGTGGRCKLGQVETGRVGEGQQGQIVPRARWCSVLRPCFKVPLSPRVLSAQNRSSVPWPCPGAGPQGFPRTSASEALGAAVLLSVWVWGTGCCEWDLGLIFCLLPPIIQRKLSSKCFSFSLVFTSSFPGVGLLYRCDLFGVFLLKSR